MKNTSNMKTVNKIYCGFASALLLLSACSDFEDINKDPNAVNEENVKTSYLLNKSIVGAQQNPEISERIFVIQWKSAARFERRGGLAVGANYDVYNDMYFSTSYGVAWLNNINKAVQLSE